MVCTSTRLISNFLANFLAMKGKLTVVRRAARLLTQ
jgi:hypothetical protein